MLAIFKDRTVQHKVRVGDKVLLALNAEAQPGDTLEFSEVLLVADDKNNVQIGTPLVEGAKVIAKVGKEFRDKKVITVKFRRRKESRTKRGHRQRYTTAVISEISNGKTSVKA